MSRLARRDLRTSDRAPVEAPDPEPSERDSIVLNQRKAKGGERQRSREEPPCHWSEVAITRRTSDCGY
jgi:hypothetical protein